MTPIKSLLFLFGIGAALFAPRYELWCLDKYWRGAMDDAVAVLAVDRCSGCEMAPGAACLRCWSVAPGEDDESDDD